LYRKRSERFCKTKRIKMDIEILASNVEIEIASGKIEPTNVNVVDLMKKIISEIKIDGLMEAVHDASDDTQHSELVVWLDHKYDFEDLIDELDDEERSEEILDHLKTNKKDQ